MGKVKKEKNSKNLQDKICETEGGRKHKNAEKSKSSTDDGTKKYGYISTNSVISMAESAGFSGIQEDVAKNLAEDVTYRLRYIIQQCKKYMIHSKSKKLRSSDISQVLRMCDIPTIYGYAADNPLHNFTYIKEAELFILEDEVIDLPSFALNDALVLKKPQFFATGRWLKLEEKTCSKNLLHSDNARLGNENEEHETKIPTNLIKYYGITCNTLLGHSDLKIILQDLSKNSRIIPIIPYVLNFITIALNKLNSERQLQRLLQAVEALSKNKNVDFTPYSATTRVINAMLVIVVSDKKPAKISHDFQLKSYAAHVLSLVLRQWCYRDEQKQIVVKKMANILCDFKVPANIHYGALALLTALGPEALMAGFWKTLKRYLSYLEELKLTSDFKSENDLAMLEDVVLTASVSLYRCTLDEALLPELDGHLCSYFGDAMCNLRLKMPTPCANGCRHNAASSAFVDAKCFRNFKYVNWRNKSRAEKLSPECVFALPKMRRKKNSTIIFNFAGAMTVPEISLKKRRWLSRYSQLIARKKSGGHVIVTGKFSRVPRPRSRSPFYSLFSLL